MKRWLMILILALAAGLFVRTYATSAQGGTTEDEKCLAKGGIYDSSAKICDIESGYTIKVNYPMALTESNKYIEQVVDKYVDDTRKGFIKDYNDATAGTPAFRTWALQIDAKTYDFSKDLVTVRLDAYVYTGGAHGGTAPSTYILDLKNQKELMFNDLFVANSKPLEKIAPLAAADLKKQLGDMADEKWIGEGTAPKPENYSTYALSDKGLVLIFGQYQVAPYAAGILEVTIPFDALKGLIKPEYSK